MKYSWNMLKNGMLPNIGRTVAPKNTRVIIFEFLRSTSIFVENPERNMRKMRPN